MTSWTEAPARRLRRPRNADTLGESKCAHGEGRTRMAGMATGVKARRVYQFRHVGAEVTPDGSHAWWHCVGKESGGWRSGSHSRAATRCYLLTSSLLSFCQPISAVLSHEGTARLHYHAACIWQKGGKS